MHNGESADTRRRGGLKTSDQGWSFHCFNCGYKASFVMGRNITYKARRFLQWLNVSPEDIERINLESMRHRSMQSVLDDRAHTQPLPGIVDFEPRDLPDNFVMVDANTPDHREYLTKRCIPEDFPVGALAPATENSRPGIVIPFTHKQQIVGSAIRFLDDRIPKYINDTQPGYVFGVDLQHPNWNHVLVMEGVFDALSISGVAVLHADINEAQARLIRSLGREITVVPDQDAAGMKLVDRALELGWAVSMPDWPPHIKDVNDAVVCWGRLTTLITIMQARTTSLIKIEMRRKQIAKRLQH